MAGFVAAIPGIVGGAAQIFAGRGASKAAGVASNIQAGAYQDARDLFHQGMNEGNKYLQDASGNAIKWAGDAADYAGGQALDQARASSQDVSDRALAAGNRVTSDTATANALLDPYVQAGAKSVGQLSDLANQQFQFNQDDPSYQWRLQQGQQALERSAAARGGSLGGAAAKAMARYGQGAASTEYQAAFDRFNQNRNSRGQLLSGMVGIGANAAGRSGQNTIEAGRYAGDINYRAGEYGGNTMNQATQYAGNAGMRAAEYGGNMAYNTARDLTDNTNLGYRNMNNMTLGRADALAGGILGQQQGKNQMWSGLGTMLSGVSQGFKPRAPGMTPDDMGYTPPDPSLAGLPSGFNLYG